MLAGAQTGTGKTAAFTLPLLHRLSLEAALKNKFGGKGLRALVLTPTRELAAQVQESVRQYGKYLDMNSTVVFGGVRIRKLTASNAASIFWPPPPLVARLATARL